jgi:hypothetical protein
MWACHKGPRKKAQAKQLGSAGTAEIVMVSRLGWLCLLEAYMPKAC